MNIFDKELPEVDKTIPCKNGLNCPDCGDELLDSKPHLKRRSWPPEIEVHCEKCGFQGYRTFEY